MDKEMINILKNNTYISDIKRVIEKFDLSELNNKSLLITGGLGLICSAVVDLLIIYNDIYGANIKIYVAARNKDKFLSRYGEYTCAEYIAYDATRPIEFDVDIDYIIHGAGNASPELYVSRPVETMLANIDGVRNLLEYSRKREIRRLLYVSSSEVYGVKDNADAFEENRLGVTDINSIRSSYSESKRAAEVLCKSYSSEYDVDTVIVRPGHVYGPSASAQDKRVSSEFAYLAAEGKPLKMKSLGLQKRSYCYSLDCAVAIIIALLKGDKGESYNIGHCEITSIREMAKILAEAGNVDLEINDPTEEDLRQFNPMNNSTLNNERIKSIGYEDTFSVREGLTHTVKILRDTLNGCTAI